ncbi:zinc finger protein ZAT4 [Carica papaya]|uniref:zinc finger protein ZAT4 n=1 Tax=Carica papaya TaxID=3649 RepID=UPI000B8D089B|nr:zinc finger protein ZAT4 [Carica papaya]
MEKHKCKLCARTFNNGRALGGHMKAHLTTLPLPPKTHHQLAHPSTDSASSSSPQNRHKTTSTNLEVEDKSLIYSLRENPKKSFRVADPEFSFAADSAAGSVVQDRESETESRNPTRRRSKRNRRHDNTSQKKPIWDETTSSPEPASSVSDTSPEEDVALCLIMLSRDVWKKNKLQFDESDDTIKSKHRCEKCKKVFKSYHALVGHRRICLSPENFITKNHDQKSFQCPFCFRFFASGQALGGHKRSHLLVSSSSSSSVLKNSFIDLNMPAPVEDDQFSVVSDS